MAAKKCAESVALFRALGDKYWLACALMILGGIQVSQGKPEAAGASLEECRSLLREEHLPLSDSTVLYHLGRAAFALRDIPAARALFEQSLASFRQEGDMLGEGVALGALGVIASVQGDIATAESLLAQSLPLMREAGARRDLTLTLLAAGTERLKQGDLKQAQNLFARSLRLWERLGTQENANEIKRSLEGLAEVAVARNRRSEPECCSEQQRLSRRRLPIASARATTSTWTRTSHRLAITLTKLHLIRVGLPDRT